MKKNKSKEKEKSPLTIEQDEVVKNNKKRLVVSASAGSGKTFVVVEKLVKLICEEKIPISRLLVLTFTKAAANELKTRLYNKILEQKSSTFLIEQLDEIIVSDISTIDAFCEKIIKRNINKLDFSQNFTVLDEKSAKKLKNSAFKRAFNDFSSQKSDDFEKLYFAFKRSGEAIEECMLSMQAFFDSNKNGDQLKKDFSQNLSHFHQKACKELKEKVQASFQLGKKFVEEALLLAQNVPNDVAKQQYEFADNLMAILQQDFSKEFFDLCKNVTSVKMPAISTSKCDKDVKARLVKAKEVSIEGYDICKNFQFATPATVAEAESGNLSKILFEFYDFYVSHYQSLKEKRGAFDFADLERYAYFLLGDDEVRKSLQERYDYIVIDEYQDTNRLQESILKPIAEKGHFIAVGDIKQGIYGFRNANKAIMSGDIEEFKADKENSSVLYLKGNFRTDKRVLDFVNNIFQVLMTEKSVGINYLENSMLEGKITFLPNSLPPTRVDIVFNGKAKSPKVEEEQETGQKDEWQDVYSVKDDQMESGLENIQEILAIESRIEEVLKEKIYLPKQKMFRQVEEGDIALLFRNRTSLMEELALHLEAKGYMVNADIKENLLEDSQISLLISLLKLTIVEDDDIPLASVMASHFGGFTLEELSHIRHAFPQNNFYEIVKGCISENANVDNLKIDAQKIKVFYLMLKEFKFDIQVFGIIKAFEKLFNKTEYFDFLQTFEDGEVKRGRINKLFSLIRSGNMDFAPQEVIATVENSSKDEKVGGGGGNSITLTTIHATKGLEYPIVILCGCGEKLGKAYNKNYIVTKEFGLASHSYSFDANFKMISPAFFAGKMALKNREFVDEIMLFYVAMTRAKNHLYIIGKGKKEDFSFDKIENQKSYLALTLFALGENFAEQLFEQECVQTLNCTYSVVTEIEMLPSQSQSKSMAKNEEREQIDENLSKLYDFSYKNKKYCKISLKNSVTGLNKIGEDEEYKVGEVLYKDEGEERKINENSTQILARQKAIEVGNSYHEALKLIDFSKVKSEEDLQNEFKKAKPFMQEGYAENIDINLLYKNVVIIKETLKNNKPFKEREFIMDCTLEEIEALKNGKLDDLLFQNSSNGQSVIVQGIVDLFGFGDKLILIDYKYTSITDENLLISHYKGQLDLYENALQKAFGRKVDQKFLLSLKNAKLIKVE